MFPESLQRRATLVAALIGLCYGLLCRYFFGNFQTSFGVMTVGFLVLTPFGIGFIVSFLSERAGRPNRVYLPLVTTAAMLMTAYLMLWEGLICLVMLAPLAVVTAILGGLAGGIAGKRFTGGGNTPIACVAILPFLVAPVEHWTGPLMEVRTVETSIDIQADPATVWRHIERVAPIRPEEEVYSWTQSIGFPRPIEATLSKEGVGGVRHARFAGGLLFVETVTAWEPQSRLVFEIRADTANIPPTTLDEHVTIGGPYFDTLEGEYRIEPLAGGGVRLHLSSRHRLSTTFNFYAGLWTDAVMRDIQNNILHVVRRRCER